MNSKLILAAAAAAAFVTPAYANPVSGPRLEVVAGLDNANVDEGNFAAGVDDSANGVVWGLGAGYDVAVGGKSAIGIDVEANESTAGWAGKEDQTRWDIDLTRDLYAGARFTTQVMPNVALYAKVGYTNLGLKARDKVGNTTTIVSDHADGVRGALGAQYLLDKNVYFGAEYRYSNYEGGLSRNNAVVTAGYRF
ncbi:MAG: porin family protein [Porphyrobacter sp.]|nr:porin family protein [Porphyrobacter sp.]